MNKEPFSTGPSSSHDETQPNGLAISVSNERIYTDAQSYLDPDSIKRFCQVWGEVGRAILNRRGKDDVSQGKRRFNYPGGWVHQSVG